MSERSVPILNETDSLPSSTFKGEELSGGHASDSDAEERRVWRKLDWHLLPFVSLLYLLSFLDRANIGNAKLAGMEKDLDLVGLKYNIAAAMFFIPYSLFEVPSNILLKLTRPSRWIPSIMIAWGIVMTLMCRVHSYEGLIIARVFLGVAEAGLFPGVTFYISLWYPRHMQAKRIAIFFSAATIAGAFGGILAFGIERLDGRAGLHGWQWIFLIEGLLTVAVAFASYFFMHDYPETATFLTEEERAFVVETLRTESHNAATHFSFKFVWQALADWKSWLQAAVDMGTLIPVYAVALFMPSVISGLGFTNAAAQLLTIPPFVTGCLATIVVGFYSDKWQLRGPFIAGGTLLSMVGYIIAYTTSAPGPGYVAAFIACVGVYPTIAVALAWAGGNAGGDMKRGVVIAMATGISNMGGICSSFVYYDPPRYHHGHGTMIGWLGLSVLGSCVLMYTYWRKNKAKEEYCRAYGVTQDMQDEFRDLGDESPLFRYVL